MIYWLLEAKKCWNHFPIEMLSFYISRRNSCATKVVITWEYISVRRSLDKKVKCFITDECCICAFFEKIYCPLLVGNIFLSRICNTSTVEWRNIIKGVKYTLPRHFTIQCITASSFSRPISIMVSHKITGIRARADVLLCLQLKTLRTLSPKNFQ